MCWRQVSNKGQNRKTLRCSWFDKTVEGETGRLVLPVNFVVIFLGILKIMDWCCKQKLLQRREHWLQKRHQISKFIKVVECRLAVLWVCVAYFLMLVFHCVVMSSNCNTEWLKVTAFDHLHCKLSLCAVNSDDIRTLTKYLSTSTKYSSDNVLLLKVQVQSGKST